VRTTIVPVKNSTGIRRFLKGLSRKSWRKNAADYILGLIILVRFRAIAEIARCTFGGAVDTAQHFIHDSPWSPSILQEEMQKELAARFGGKSLYLIIDDTPVKRDGKHIEGLGVHHGPDGLAKGLCAVTSVIRIGTRTYAWAVVGYRPKKSAHPGEFKTKIEIAHDILKSARILGENVTVLFDSWYSCETLLNYMAENSLRYVAAIKSNRVIYIGNRKHGVSNLAKGPRKYRRIRLSKKRTVYAAKRIVSLKGIGNVALFITKIGGKTKFLISNDLGLSEEEAVRTYAERFAIETFHRDIKQHLGFGELWMRSWQGVQKHWTLCMAAFNSLNDWNAALPARRRGKTFGQIIREFRRRPKPLKTNKSLDSRTSKN
jgi:SRSO17 transposase